MPLPVPDLDDRTFDQLVSAARARIQQVCPEWTDLSPHDPGMALVEVFAYLTETMLYRLNRLPEKAYVEFLNLIGLRRRPPVAASVELELTRPAARTGDITIPAGAAVEGPVPPGGGTPATFVLTQPVTIPVGTESVRATAYSCTVVEAEHVGDGTGRGGQWVRTGGAPMAETGERDEVAVLVEADGGDVVREDAVTIGSRTFERWQLVDAFVGLGPDDRACIVDRAAGVVTFAPSTGDDGTPAARVPGAGRQIRVTYRTGGGRSGNVAARSLTRWKGRDPGVQVSNPAPARGGRDLEPIDAALLRGPQEFHTLQRAVTARDFELLAVQSSGAIARARAVTRAALWTFATPGEVEVVVVPAITAAAGEPITHATLLLHQEDDALTRTREGLDVRRPLGTRCTVGWARCKAVSVHVSLAVRAEEDADALRQRVLTRLYDMISPLPTAQSRSGWQFGHALRASNVFRAIEESEPGVVYVHDLRFVLDDAPDGAIQTLAADQYQARTWFAGQGDALYRSTNDGDGWELSTRFSGDAVWDIATYPRAARPGLTDRPGLVAAVAHHQGDTGAAVHVSTDLGETWRRVADFTDRVRSVAWLDRGDQEATLLLATDAGLYELSMLPGATPLPVNVEPSDQDRAFEAVVTFTGARGEPCVALAAQAQHGVYLSVEGGRPGTFEQIGMEGRDIRSLAVQVDGTATMLWVGLGEGAADAERGAMSARLFEADVRWEPRSTGWAGGTCWELAFRDDGVAVAATQSGGVLRLDTRSAGASWAPPPDVNCGLPLRDLPRFAPVTAVGTVGAVMIAGTASGVHRSADGGLRFESVAHQGGADPVTIPETWLLCSATHEVEIVERDAARVH